MNKLLENFDIDSLDPGIRDVVVLLRENGFRTFTSCEGGEGHAFEKPTVRVALAGNTFAYDNSPVTVISSEVGDFLAYLERNVVKCLVEGGYCGFYTKIVQSYQRSPEPWFPETYSFLEVEFWGPTYTEK